MLCAFLRYDVYKLNSLSLSIPGKTQLVFKREFLCGRIHISHIV